ncbi:ABC-type transport auxiliary lipoprotein family protein [Acidihalobacter ferrooxydans]|nr:ABC-type transport auxiliary lipoprotein family protein [Acidihalobacter ferrooxydans]
MNRPNQQYRHKLRWATRIGVLALASSLSACTVLPERAPPHPITTYRLTLPTTTQPTGGAANCASVRINAMTTAAGFSGTAMRYSEAAGTIADFAFNRWAAPPARMLDPLLVQSMSNSGLFRSVLGPGSPATATLQLDTELISLVQRVTGSHSTAHLVMRVSVNNLTTEHQIAARQFVIDQTASAATPEAGVTATDAAVARWNTELIDWLRQLGRSGLCPS